MDIENIKIKKPLLLVETDKIIVKGNYNNFSAKIIKTAENSDYKIGDIIYTDANPFVPFVLDGITFENIYQINETTVKGEIQMVISNEDLLKNAGCILEGYKLIPPNNKMVSADVRDLKNWTSEKVNDYVLDIKRIK